MAIKDWLGQFETTRTTVTLPTRLVEHMQAVIDRGLVPNRNAVITVALESFLDELERREIDDAFAVIADDVAYRELSREIEEVFAEADWEAFTGVESAQ